MTTAISAARAGNPAPSLLPIVATSDDEGEQNLGKSSLVHVTALMGRKSKL